MSSKPYPGGATELIKMARRIGGLEARIPVLRQKAIAAMKERDVAGSTGNFGWEDRVGYIVDLTPSIRARTKTSDGLGTVLCSRMNQLDAWTGWRGVSDE